MKGRHIFFSLRWPHSSVIFKALVSCSSRCVPWNSFTHTLVKSSENYQCLHHLFYYVYILFVFWIVPSQLVNSKHQITFSYYSHVWRSPPAEVRHWAKAASLLPNIQAFRRDPLFAETSHQFPENFLPYLCVCSCVWAHVNAGNVPSTALHSVYGGQMPHWLTKCRYSLPWGIACPPHESCRLQAGHHACPAFIFHIWGSGFQCSHLGGKCSTQRAIFPTQNL